MMDAEWRVMDDEEKAGRLFIHHTPFRIRVETLR
jgi:hypothetical protein